MKQNQQPQPQPTVMTRQQFGNMLEQMTVEQALSNFDALIKVCLGAGLYKDRTEVLASDMALTILETTATAFLELQKEAKELQDSLVKSKDQSEQPQGLRSIGELKHDLDQKETGAFSETSVL